MQDSCNTNQITRVKVMLTLSQPMYSLAKSLQSGTLQNLDCGLDHGLGFSI